MESNLYSCIKNFKYKKNYNGKKTWWLNVKNELIIKYNHNFSRGCKNNRNKNNNDLCMEINYCTSK